MTEGVALTPELRARPSPEGLEWGPALEDDATSAAALQPPRLAHTVVAPSAAGAVEAAADAGAGSSSSQAQPQAQAGATTDVVGLAACAPLAIGQPASASVEADPTPAAAAETPEVGARPSSGALATAGVQSAVIPLCPVGDEPRLRNQLSRCRTQLHTAQLQLHRASGELSAATKRLGEGERQRRQLQARVEDQNAQLEALGAVDSGGGLDKLRGELHSLAEARLSEMKAALERKDEQLRQLQATTWGAWASDVAVGAELKRLQAELSQAHALQRRHAERSQRAEQEVIRAREAAGGTQAALEVQVRGLKDELERARVEAERMAVEYTQLEGVASVRANECERLRASEGGLLLDLQDREQQLSVASAQVETLQED